MNRSNRQKHPTKLLEIDLPKDFCLENDKEALFKLFSDNLKTGGDKILKDRSTYDPHSQNAFIYYEKSRESL